MNSLSYVFVIVPKQPSMRTHFAAVPGKGIAVRGQTGPHCECLLNKYLSFFSMKPTKSIAIPPGWDASSTPGYPPAFC